MRLCGTRSLCRCVSSPSQKTLSCIGNNTYLAQQSRPRQVTITLCQGASRVHDSSARQQG